MRIRSALVIGTLGTFAVVGMAQQKPTKSSSTSSNTSQNEHASAPASPAQANPFAEAKSQAAQRASSAKPGDKQPSAPAPPAQANPFPEAKSQAAAAKANGTSETQGSSGVSSSHVNLSRFSAGASRDERISNGHGGYIHDPELAKRDDKVGLFYLRTGDYKGAYDRYLEATRVDPEDANAVFGLAQSARGLGKLEVAETNYLVYLDAIPDGKHSKSALKALKSIEKERAHKGGKK